MQKKRIKTFFEFLELVEQLKKNSSKLLLFRGQSEIKPLIPSIARNNSSIDTTDIEKKMLEEIKRRTQMVINGQHFDDWDWLIYAQHFGMKTRLLDWTSNPLTALWFACEDEYKKDSNSVVYILNNADDFFLDRLVEKSPFNKTKTKILKPTLNNERIIAQAGWFTSHKYSTTTKSFVDLRINKEIKESIIEVVIPKELKSNILESLNVFGINSQTLFPDITGICNHINWEFTK